MALSLPMKTIAQKGAVGEFRDRALLVALLVLAGIVPLKAQETLQFTSFMVSPYTDATGQGVFTLTDQFFMYDVRTYPGFFIAEIHGPGPDEAAPLMFTLQLQTCIAPGGYVTNDGCYFRGGFDLSENQISQLVDHQWYVWAFTPSAPSHDLSGQIVPEPTAYQLLLISLFPFYCWLATKRRA
jgi:hypothetical protein